VTVPSRAFQTQSKTRTKKEMRIPSILSLAVVALGTPALGQQNAIVHDAEYYILEAQNGEAWAEED
jgi:arylsulfatase